MKQNTELNAFKCINLFIILINAVNFITATFSHMKKQKLWKINFARVT